MIEPLIDHHHQHQQHQHPPNQQSWRASVFISWPMPHATMVIQFLGSKPLPGSVGVAKNDQARVGSDLEPMAIPWVHH